MLADVPLKISMYLLLPIFPSTYSEMKRSDAPETPTFAQLNVFGTTDTRFTVPQLSVEPLLICAGVMLAVPAAFNGKVIF